MTIYGVMGIELPQPIEFCEWDNDLWPPGQTPAKMYVSFAGIEHYESMPDDFLWDVNRLFLLSQVNAFSWVFDNGFFRVVLSLSSGGTTLRFYGPYIWFWIFDCSSAVGLGFFLENQIPLPSPYYYNGFASVWPAIEMNEVADNLAVSTDPKTFSEILGRDLRLAQRQQGTCVYYRKVQNV